MSRHDFRAGAVISVGECMVELARGADGRFGLAFGGDTFNTAVYLARSGVPVAYATRLGDDPYSDGIRTLARAEGIDDRFMATSAGRMPGLYMIETSAAGERSFWYWRERAPARETFDAEDAALASAIQQSAAIYFSGVTLSLFGADGLARFERILRAAKSSGARVVMDNNYRPRGWAGDSERARTTFHRFWSLADIALPTFDDEQALWGDTTPADTVRRLMALGIGEIVVKNGPAGATVSYGSDSAHVACPQAVTPLDTTAAGDSFNGGYLAARIGGAPPAAAALAGHRLAAVVIQHRGAIVPRVATDPVTRARPA
jgi:2-dehydro-3-deoxygluconokinase